MRKKIVVIFLMAVSFVSFADEITLQDAIAIGLENNYGVRIERESAEKLSNNKLLGTGYLLPRVDAKGGVNHSAVKVITAGSSMGAPAGDYDRNAASAEVALSWTLFDGIRMFKARSMIYKQADLGDAKLRDLMEETVLNITVAYYNVVGAKKAIDLAEKIVAISQSRYDRAKIKNDIGLLGKRELLNSETALNNDKTTKLNSELVLLRTKNSLNTLLGRDASVEFEPAYTYNEPAPLLSLDSCLSSAVLHNGSVKKLDISIGISEKKLSIERGAFSPQVVAMGSYGYANSLSKYESAEIRNENATGVVGLNLNWNLMSGFSRITSVKNAKLDLSSAKLSKEDYLNRLKSLVIEQYKTFQHKSEMVIFSKKAVEASKTNLEVSEELFKIGKISDVQFREAQVSYAKSVINLINSKLALLTTDINMKRLIGKMEF